MERRGSGIDGRRAAFIAALAVALGVLAVAVTRWVGSPQQHRGAAASASAATSADGGGGRAARRAERPSVLHVPSASAERDQGATHGRFEGRVVSTLTSRGVPRASLTFERAGVATSVQADGDGQFRFDPPEVGSYALVLAAAEGYRTFAPALGDSPVVVEARAGQRVGQMVIYLSPEVTYLVSVRDREGNPIAGAAVRVLEAASASATGTRAAGRTDERGELSLSAGDDAVIEARHPDHAVGRASIDLVVQASKKVTIVLGPKPARQLDEVISGRVLDGDGLPIADALVSATPTTDEPATLAARSLPTLHAVTDAEGRFTVDGLDAEHYDLSAMHEGYAPASADRVPSATIDLVLVLARGGRLFGTAVDGPSGAPLTAFAVVVSARVGPLEYDPVAQATIFDAEGRWEIEGVPPGQHTITVVAQGFAPSAETAVTMPEPTREVGPLEIRLSRGGRVHGTVIDEKTRAPLEGARVSLEGRLGGGDAAVPLLAATNTDAAGRFELFGLGAGLRSLAVTAAGHHGRIVSGLAVAEGGDVGPVEVQLAPTKPGEEPRLELTGIGAVLSGKDDALRIGEVLPGGGAAQAGIVPGDSIVSVDGVLVTELGFEPSIQRIRGPEGSTVALGIRHQDGNMATVTVRRTRIR